MKLCPTAVSDSRTARLPVLSLSNEVSIERHGISHLIERAAADSANHKTLLPTQRQRLVIFVHPRRDDGALAKITARVVHTDPVDGTLHSPRFAEGRPRPERAVAGKGGGLQDAVNAVLGRQRAREFGIPHVGANQKAKAKAAGSIAGLDFKGDGATEGSRLEKARFGADSIIAQVRLVVHGNLQAGTVHDDLANRHFGRRSVGGVASVVVVVVVGSNVADGSVANVNSQSPRRLLEHAVHLGVHALNFKRDGEKSSKRVLTVPNGCELGQDKHVDNLGRRNGLHLMLDPEYSVQWTFKVGAQVRLKGANPDFVQLQWRPRVGHGGRHGRHGRRGWLVISQGWNRRRWWLRKTWRVCGHWSR